MKKQSLGLFFLLLGIATQGVRSGDGDQVNPSAQAAEAAAVNQAAEAASPASSEIVVDDQGESLTPKRSKIQSQLDERDDDEEGRTDDDDLLGPQPSKRQMRRKSPPFLFIPTPPLKEGMPRLAARPATTPALPKESPPHQLRQSFRKIERRNSMSSYPAPTLGAHAPVSDRHSKTFTEKDINRTPSVGPKKQRGRTVSVGDESLVADASRVLPFLQRECLSPPDVAENPVELQAASWLPQQWLSSGRAASVSPSTSSAQVLEQVDDSATEDDDPTLFRLTKSFDLIYRNNTAKTIISSELNRRPATSLQAYFGLTGVFQPYLSQFAQKLTDKKAPSAGTCPKAFLCYAWITGDDQKNSIWQKQEIQPMRDFLRQAGIEATMDIIDNCDGEIAAYRQTILTTDFIIAVVDQNFIREAKKWKQWKEKNSKRESRASDIADSDDESAAPSKRNIWKEFDAIHERIQASRSLPAKEKYQLVFPLMLEGVSHEDITEIWPDGFITHDIQDPEKKFLQFPSLVVKLHELYQKKIAPRSSPETPGTLNRIPHEHIKLLEKQFSALHKSCQSYYQKILSDADSSEPFEALNLDMGHQSCIKYANLREIHAKYEDKIEERGEGGMTPHSVRSARSTPPHSQEEYLVSLSPVEEDIWTPNSKTLEETFRDLRELPSFDLIEKHLSPSSRHSEIGLIHLIMAERFEMSLPKVSKRKDLSVAIGRVDVEQEHRLNAYGFALKAYERAACSLDQAVVEFDWADSDCVKCFKAHALSRRARLILSQQLKYPLKLEETQDQNLSRAEKLFTAAITAEPTYFYANYSLAKIYISKKNHKTALEHCCAFLESVHQYEKGKSTSFGGASSLDPSVGFEEIDTKPYAAHVRKIKSFLEEIASIGKKAEAAADRYSDLWGTSSS